jgi:drug/metabolite transporter (DMT)-like permease
MGWLWVVFTVLAAGGQATRNALQRELTEMLGTVGATHVRFLYGLPFGLLFCLLALAVTGAPLPHMSNPYFAWAFAGAVTQIIATGLLLTAMRDKSFVVITALSKTEPVHVAIVGLALLGDTITLGLAFAIALATLGVLIVSWPKPGTVWAPRAVTLGLVSASFFAVSAIAFRRAILTLDGPTFFVNASATLATGLLIQVVLMTGYLALFDRRVLFALIRAWRPSVKAGFMGAFASQMWFCAFALQSAAIVRTLGLVEILFAQAISRNIFKQKLTAREALGIGLIIAGVGVLLNQA